MWCGTLAALSADGGMRVTGLVVDGSGFELLVDDERVGPRRVLGPDDVALLEALASRYTHAVRTRADPADPAVLVELGRELWRWLEGDGGALTALLDRAPTPLVFEVRGPRRPREGVWAVAPGRPPRALPVGSWQVVRAVPGTLSRRPRQAGAPWRLEVGDGTGTGSLAGAWLALAWIGSLAGWPEPAGSDGT